MATNKENSNSIIYFAEKGFTYKDVVEFWAFVESHQPTEKEVNDAMKKLDEKNNM